MDFYDVLDQVAHLLQRRQRVTRRALQLHFQLDDAYLEALVDELRYAHPDNVHEEGGGLVWTGASPLRRAAEAELRFHALLPEVIALLQREGRVTYRRLQHLFCVDDAFLQEVREELRLRQLAVDEADKVLVWLPPHIPEADRRASGLTIPPEHLVADVSHVPSTVPQASMHSPLEAERRQLTVMFCDLVGSTDLSGRLDPEDLREVVRAYQESAAEVIDRYQGHIAQYLGDGLLIYFGFPLAHEDDAQRAVHTGLEIPEAIAELNTRLAAQYGVQLAVRIGIHTGPVVVGEMGGGDRHENLALGETPNIAARLEGLAPPNAAVISPVTAQLVQRAFVLEELGLRDLKGVAEPMLLYTVVRPREVEHDDREAMPSGDFETLVGRDEEIGLLRRCWQQSKEGQGQVVCISGEAGLGKSSLVEGLRVHVRREGHTRMALRCSPYTANSALHPVLEHVQRVLDWQREDDAGTRLSKLEQALAGTSQPLTESVPLLAVLLSLPLPEGRYPPLALSAPQQRQQTLDVLAAWMLEEAERQPLLAVWEDLHWADPSTLELLGLLIEQAATVPMMNVLAYRPSFVPPWPSPSHLTPLTLNRLERVHAEALIARLARGKDLPAEVVAHIVTKTDGVPLYVEELTKMLLESELLEEQADAYVLRGALSSASIPATLQDSLMARLDRLPEAREVAQLGAVLGREFTYEMLAVLASMDEATLQAHLSQLVDTELLYQRGRIPRAKYMFRHALIRDAGYASLLRRTRQHHHEQVAQLLEARFPEVVETQPELVAHHYTEAGLVETAIGYWQRAGQRASERLAYSEAVSHLTTGLRLLQSLPETLARHQQELPLQTALGAALLVVRGQGASEVEAAFTRARALCQQLGDSQDVFPVLLGLWRTHVVRSDYTLARQLGEELLSLAEQRDASSLYVVAHYALGLTCFSLGELLPARRHLEAGRARYTPDQRRSPMFRAGHDPGVACHAYAAWTLWLQGYPEQALARARDALALASELTHPFTDAFALVVASILRQFRREARETSDHAVAAVALSTEQGFPLWLAVGTIMRGWAMAAHGQREKGLAQMRQGLADWRASGSELFVPCFLTLMAEQYGALGRMKEGLEALQEGLDVMGRTREHWCKAEVYRLQGELLLRQTTPDVAQAEHDFHQALDIARRQHAKSLELRAAASLARLWQSRDKRQEAYDLLSPVYGWFTEGLDTADLQEAKALLSELG